MLQFNKSQATNTNAVYLETVNTGSGYYNDLVIAYSQSYDQSNGTFNVTASSVPTQYNNWLVFTATGSVVPSYTGQYDVELYTATTTGLVWNQAAQAWNSVNQAWNAATGTILDALLYSDRAFVSGSNESSITQYISSDENGTYTTYNG